MALTVIASVIFSVSGINFESKNLEIGQLTAGWAAKILTFDGND